MDTSRGIVATEGCDELGYRYPAHPDTGKVMNGFVLPDWEQAVEMCRQAALLAPQLKYLSWDLAHTDEKGWVVIEVNPSGQFLHQIALLTGIRAELKAIAENMDLLLPCRL